MNAYSPRPHTSGIEIDLIAPLKMLWAHKWTLVFTAVLFAAIAFTATFFMKPVYQIQMTLKPPFASQIAALDFSTLPENHGALHSMKAEEVFDFFYENLASETVRQEFFSQFYWPEILKKLPKITMAHAYKQFSRNVTMHNELKKGFFTVSIKGNNPVRLVQWFSQLTKIAEKLSKEQMHQNVVTEAALISGRLKTEIDQKRLLARQERLDRLVQLKEAIKVASVASPTQSNTIVLNYLSNSGVISDSPNTMYLRGAEVLKLEMKNLQQRHSDDAFIPGLRMLLSNLNLYQHFKPDFAQVTLFRRDGNLEVPQAPISPKRMIITFMALLLGLFAGSLFVFIRIMLRK